jgi:mono/diheme cytochrome c family protein
VRRAARTDPVDRESLEKKVRDGQAEDPGQQTRGSADEIAAVRPDRWLMTGAACGRCHGSTSFATRARVSPWSGESERSIARNG